MKLELHRFSSNTQSTLGMLHKVDEDDNGKHFLCFTLEDEHRTVKKWGDTRIPAGEYKVTLRKEGGYHERYRRKFGDMHKGMLYLNNVPNFEWILIHIGNTEKDTAGCILVGDIATQNVSREGVIGSSTNAYKRIYPEIARALEKGEEVVLKVVDFDEAPYIRPMPNTHVADWG